MRELRVEDALMYLDQVKMEFGDRPHIYNEFLDIMKTFKSQQIDTPGVIRRVSALFHGNKKLVLGFNTFLPEGYKIELPMDGNGAPVAVYRAPGQTGVTQILGPGIGDGIPPSTLINGGVGVGVGGDSGSGTGPPAASSSSTSSQQQPRIPPSSGGGGSTGPSSEHPEDVITTTMASPSSSQMQSMSTSTSPRHGPTLPPAPSVEPPSLHIGTEEEAEEAEEAEYPTATASSSVIRLQVAAPVAASVAARQENETAAARTTAPPSPPAQQQEEEEEQQPVEFDHAINYVTTIKKRFQSEPETYKSFLDILHTYQKEQRGIKEVLDEVSTLFADHPDLLREFTYFLPDAVQAQAKAQLTEVAKAAEIRNKQRAAKANKTTGKKKPSLAPTQPHAPQQEQPQPAPSPPPTSSSPPAPAALPANPATQQAPQVTSTTPSVPAPVPFGASQGRSEEREREICRSAIYGVITFAPTRPPKKNELTPSHCATKYGRPRTIPELPLQPSVAESAFLEKAKQHLTRKELAPDKLPGSRRHTPYAEFLKCMHLFGANLIAKEELVLLLRGLFMQGHAPKSGIHAGGASSNPTVAAAANDLMKELDRVLVGRGPYANQTDRIKNVSKYGCMSIRDHEWNECKNPTPSYYTYPSDYPKEMLLVHSGQSPADASVLNNTLICYNYKAKKGYSNNNGASNNLPQQSLKNYPSSPEEYDGPKIRRNIYEETMFKIEEERFEVDMAIERNSSAMRQMEPLAEEAGILKEGEESDGQPIGRMQYKLRHRSLGSTHIGSIARVYGEAGDEVVHHLLQNPIAVLPIVHKRLLAKDSEWRKVRISLTQHWRKVTDSNCHGSLDVTCYFYRKELERSFVMDWLIEECQRARHYFKHPRKQPNHPVTTSTSPNFYNFNSDVSLYLFQPHISIHINNNMPHKEVYKLLNVALLSENRSSNGGSAVSRSIAKTQAEKEKISRVWAQFIAPWFNLPIYWFLEELRERRPSTGNTTSATSSRPDKGNIVKYALGQNVRSAYGDGYVQTYIHGTSTIYARYKIKYPYGIGYIRPYAIVHALPFDPNNTPPSNTQSPTNSQPNTLQVMFTTEKIYIFLRLYSLFVQLLNEAKLSDTKNFHQIIQLLRSYKLEEISFKMYEMKCRALNPKKVCKFAALPRLLEKCAEFMIKVVKEDVLLSLYDLSQLGCSDLNLLRSMSVEVTSEATYRVQSIPTDAKLCFMFLNFDTDMIVTPPRSLLANKDQDVVMEDQQRSSNTLLEENVIVSSRGPPSKRLKLKL